MMIVSPSLLGLPVAEFPSMSQKLFEAGASWIHLDVMDGVFVPRLTFGSEALENLPKDMVKDVHLMVEHPLPFAASFLKKGADYITFHVEAVSEEEGHALIAYLHEHSCKAGISLRPMTPLSALAPFLNEVDLVLVMSVEPGKGGQPFLPQSPQRIQELAEYKKEHHASYLIEVDGGINNETGRIAKDAGAEVLVCGSYLVGKEDYAERLKGLLND
ncbi:MAG: ribulose-phosphate 3-epimerase [Candidatus Enteromonas sp.]|nr:ribulose-phosphate 3-epimerase [Candidatus Enteromonas sp.]